MVLVGCRDFAVLPPSPLVFKIVPAAVFEGRDSLVDGVSPGLATVAWWWSMWQLRAQGIFQVAFVPLLWGPDVTVAAGQHSIEHNLGQAVVRHRGTCPAQRSSISSNMASICWLFPPARGLWCWCMTKSLQDGAEAALVEALEKSWTRWQE